MISSSRSEYQGLTLSIWTEDKNRQHLFDFKGKVTISPSPSVSVKGLRMISFKQIR